MADIVTDLIGRQRRRLIATILGHCEREVYGDLTKAQQEKLREVVLTAVGTYSDFTLDCIRSANDGWVVNEDALRLLHRISEQTKRASRG